MRPVEPEITDVTPSDQDEVRSLILAGLAERFGDVDETLNRDLDDIAVAYGHGRTVVVRVVGAVVATGTLVPRRHDQRTEEIIHLSEDPTLPRNQTTAETIHPPDDPVVSNDQMTAEIVRMAVDAGHRRLGLGRLVVEQLVAIARTWGADTVVLQTTSTWEDAVAFYRSCGFAVTHHETSQFGPATWFRRELTPTLADHWTDAGD